MKIRIDKDVVSFTPEHAAEAAELEALWIKMGNCTGGTKSLQPIGVYVPSENKTATFHIEGLNDQEKREVPVIAPPMTRMCTALPATKPYRSKPENPSPSAAAD